MMTPNKLCGIRKNGLLGSVAALVLTLSCVGWAEAYQESRAPDQKELDAKSAALAKAVAAGDVRLTLQNGGTARDVATAMLARKPALAEKGKTFAIPDPDTAYFARGSSGGVVLVSKGPRGALGVFESPELREYIPLGGLESLPADPYPPYQR